jgi:alpha-L-arabinofuranosidase
METRMIRQGIRSLPIRTRRLRALSTLLAGAGLVAAACSSGGQELDLDPVQPVTTTAPGEPTTDDVPADTAHTAPPATLSAEIPAAAGEITISADSAQPLDPRLFGTNVPAWLGPDKLSDPAFQAATAALGTTLLRFPGGSWSNSYDWLACEQGDEPGGCFWTWAARPSDYAAFMRSTGLPGMWTASFNGSAEEAAAAVAFFNGDVDDERVIGVDEDGRDWRTVGEWARLRAAGGQPDPAPIRLWEVGNEIYGATSAAGPECADFGWEEVWTCDGVDYVSGDDSHDGYLEFRDAMRAVDPDIAVGAVGVPDSESWGNWGSEVITSAADSLDFYVIHHYGFGGEPDAASALAIPQQAWPDLMEATTASLAGADPSRAVPIAITEYNMVAFQDADNDRLMASALNMLYVADTLGQMAELGVTIANQWNLANGKAANGTDYGMIDADTGARNPQYYALALWTRFGDELLATDVGFSSETELSAYAGRAADGTISVLAINKTNEPTTARLRVGAGAATYTARADVAAADSLDATTVAFNGSNDPSVDLIDPPASDLGEVGPEFDHTFAPYSVTLLRLSPGT